MTDLVTLQPFERDPTTVVSAEPIRFHLSLNVSNLAKAIDFYRVLFNRPPTKQHDDYAKFDVEHPPVVFSLVPRQPGQGGSLSHMGLRVNDPAMLETYRTRLESAGICTSNRHGTVCSYARQDQLWLQDQDGNFWEIYHVEDDVPPESVRQRTSAVAAPTVTPEIPMKWEHYITAAVPDRIPADDGVLDEVQLTGTFNADVTDELLTRIVQESFRVLKPGGKLTTHGLMASAVIHGASPSLPGLASLVQKVPSHQEVIDRLTAAGFVNLRIIKFSDKAWFEIDGVGLREVKISCDRPYDSLVTSSERTVLYCGPFARLTTDNAGTFRRGERIAVSEAVWKTLREDSSADSFVFFEPDAMSSCSANGRVSR